MADSRPENEPEQQLPAVEQSTTEQDEALQVDDAAGQDAGGDNGDADSALGEDLPGSTASLASSILRYRTIHGRTYHSERGNAQYWGSNDDRQNDALDINHHALTLAIGDKLHLSPLQKDKVKTVLDVGTGTGIWAIDFGDENPDIEVIGTDISPIQPTWVPPNVRFEIEDCTENWSFQPEHFDFIHIRGLVGSIDDWNVLFQRAFDCLKPGGWLESYEISPKWESDDGTIPEGSAMAQWGNIFIEGGRQMGRTFEVLAEGLQRKAMEAAGFQDIQEKNIKQPIGRWPKDKRLKEIGQYSQLVLGEDAEGLIMFMARMAGWTREEITAYLAKFQRELRSGKHHAYYRQRVVYGRKPE